MICSIEFVGRVHFFEKVPSCFWIRKKCCVKSYRGALGQYLPKMLICMFQRDRNVIPGKWNESNLSLDKICIYQIEIWKILRKKCQKISVIHAIRNSQEENTCARVSLNKVAALRPATLLKNRLWHRCFPRTPFFTEHLWTTASVYIFIAKRFISFQS